MLIIDAHQHCWNPARSAYSWLGPELSPIDRAVEFDELAPILARHGIDRTVLVQSDDTDSDADYMLQIASDHPEIAGVVAWVPLDRPLEAADRLAQLRDDPVVVGVRTLIHNQPDPDWLLREDVGQGLAVLERAGVTFDVVSVLSRHLQHVPVIAARHPGLKIVIDHLSKPPVGAADWEPWRTLIGAAAAQPNVYAKISGLYPVNGASDWQAADLKPFVHHALDIFGADRLMYGGDWPISVLFGGYDKVFEQLSAVFDELTPNERAAILGKVAVHFYAISADRLPA